MLELWFAFKKGTLIYLQQCRRQSHNGANRCDSLSKKELWYICNNKVRKDSNKICVVIRFQKRNFDIFATMISDFQFNDVRLWFAFKKGTLIYLQQLPNRNFDRNYCCDSLSKKELWYICNNYKMTKLFYEAVVIRFQKRNFDIFATMNIKPQIIFPRCDSLSKKELWYICNNMFSIWIIQAYVVIRFQKRNFDIFATIERLGSNSELLLWFAFKKGTLIYLQQ